MTLTLTIVRLLPGTSCSQVELSYLASGGSRGGPGGSLEPPSPLPIVKYPMKMKLFGLTETKFFHFHRIFKKNEIKSAKRTQTLLYIRAPFPGSTFPEILDPPHLATVHPVTCEICFLPLFIDLTMPA